MIRLSSLIKYGVARWSDGLCRVLRNTNADVIGASNTTVQKLDSFKIPAGLLKNGDTLRFMLNIQKSGASDTATFTLRVGTTDSSSDAVILTPLLVTSSNTYGAIHHFKAASSSSLRLSGVNSSTNSIPGTSGNTPASPVTVGDFSVSDIYIGVYCTMTSGAEFPTLRAFIAELVPGG